MNKLNFLRPNIENLNTYLYSGIFLISTAILDVSLSSIFSANITSFLPNFISFLLPLILGTVGLHIISCLLYTSPSPRDRQKSRMPSSA